MIKDGDGDDGVDDVHRTLTEVRGPVEVYEVRSVTAQQGESLSTSTRPVVTARPAACLYGPAHCEYHSQWSPQMQRIQSWR